jgi:nucleoside-diphosphate-sugar epimerase
LGAQGAPLILLRSRGEAPGHAVVVFGAGLVGAALVERLRSLGGMEATSLPLDWADAALRDRELEELRIPIARPPGSAAGRRLTVVWSAGIAGFAAGPKEAAAELANFRAVLAFSERCAEDHPEAPIRFVHFSSAGGLFEGQRQVNARSVPAPRRPYGELKAAEERLLAASGIPAVVLRLSSVYGRVRTGQRAGLISTLLVNGIRRRVSSIHGSMDTLRDFVWTHDVATFGARLVLGGSDPARARTILLASGRPSSIFEVQKIIEDVLGYKIYIGHAPRATNRDDITFAHTALPPGWIASDLRANIGIVYRDAMRAGIGFGGIGAGRN